MALVNPNSLYSGAAQVFNNAPHLAFQARLLQQHYAKQEALDNYFRKLPLTINEKGVRDQERPSISKGALNLRNFYIENKDELRKGNDAKAYEYEKMFREQMDRISKSQELGLTDMNVGKRKFDPNLSYAFQSNDFLEKWRKHELPADNSEHEDFDIDNFFLPPKPYDRTEYFKNFAQLKGNDNIKRTPNKDGTQTIINNPTYEEPQKKYVMEVAADKYLHNPSFAQMVNNDLGEPNASNPLNPDFKNHFGYDIQTPIDLATAYTFNGLKPLPRTEKIQSDQLAMLNKREAFATNKMYANDALIRGRMKTAEGYKKALVDFKDAKTTEAQEGVLNKYVNNSFDAGTTRLNGTDIKAVSLDGKVYKGRVVDVPKSVKDEFIDFDKATGIGKYPDAFYMTNDKKTIIPLFLGDKVSTGGYQIKSVSKPVSIQTFKVPLAKSLISKKAQGGEVINDEFDVEDVPEGNITSPTIKTKTTKGLPIFK